MTATTSSFVDQMVEAGGQRVQIVSGGHGDPLVVLHNEFGHPGILPYHDRLAERFSVKIPFHPGFGASERPDWIFQFRDLVAAYVPILRDLGLLGARVVGLGFGAWIAAELAAFNPGAFSRMVLVAPMGIRPREGEIRHFLIRSRREVVTESFYNPAAVPEFAALYGHNDPTSEQREYWEANREMVARVAWKPHMFDLAMPAMASQVRIPTLVVHGREDAIVPVDSGVQYAELIQGARLQVLPECGHCPEIEKPEEFLGVVLPFLSA
jgi:pimeloyl-ACP methyl ester carboxylesterase